MLKKIEEDTVLASGKTEGNFSMSTRWARSIVQFLMMGFILGVAVFVMSMMIAGKPEPAARQVRKPSLPVSAQTIALASNQPTIHLYGEIRAAKTVDLRPSVGGEVVRINPNMRIGAKVKQGETLLEIERFDYEGALTEAKANLAQAMANMTEIDARIALETEQLDSTKAQLELAMRDQKRASSLHQSGNLTAKQIDDRDLIVSQRQQQVSQRQRNLEIEAARRAQQLATIDRLEWKVSQAERNLDNTIVKAPFSGVIQATTIEVGKVVGANDALVTLYSDDQLEARFTLTNAQYGRLATDNEPLIGRQIDVVWSVGGQEFRYEGEIDRIGAQIASERGGVEVYARLFESQNAAQIRPGAFVELIVPDKAYKQSARLPETALYGSDEVYVIVDGKLERRVVTVAAFEDEAVLVSQGLKDGDLALTTRLSEIEPGQSVTITNPKSDAP